MVIDDELENSTHECRPEHGDTHEEDVARSDIGRIMFGCNSHEVIGSLNEATRCRCHNVVQVIEDGIRVIRLGKQATPQKEDK